MVEIKHKDFIDPAPIVPSLWIMLEDLWRREKPDFPEFTRYDRSFGKYQG